MAAGCGGPPSDRPETAPVSGWVTYQGKPVADANVSFRPQQQGRQSSYAKTDAEGRFELQTFEFGDGALPGEHVVTVEKDHITVPDFEEEDPRYVPPPPRHLVPEKYSNPRTSGLTATVEAGRENEFTLNLEG